MAKGKIMINGGLPKKGMPPKGAPGKGKALPAFLMKGAKAKKGLSK